MLNTEFGGMNEMFVDLYADTGDKRWLDLSYKFEHKRFIEPLKHQQDNLAGKHGNTQVPKLIGSLARYAGDRRRERRRRGAILLGSRGESSQLCHRRTRQGRILRRARQAQRPFVEGRTAETCNVYNMLKLTRKLFALEPDPQYAEFEERALFNHILASIDPEDGSTCYMVPVGQGVEREYQDMFESFTCCVGSGMESHALHGDGIYYEAGDRLVDQSLRALDGRVEGRGSQAGRWKPIFPKANRRASTLQLERRGIHACTAAAGLGRRGIRRRRSTASQSPDLPNRVRTWKSSALGNRATRSRSTLPKKLHLEPLPDNPKRVAMMWGPLVLAGDLGPERADGGRGPWRRREAEPDAGVRGRRQAGRRVAQAG